MKLHPTSLTFAFTAIMTLTPASTSAQSNDPAAANRDIKVWVDAMNSSFSPGKWEGTATLTEDGVTKPGKLTVNCFKQGSLNPLLPDLINAFSVAIESADCTTQSGGAGSMFLMLDCRRGDGGHLRFTSGGSRSAKNIDWSFNITSDGPGAFGKSTMQLRARKISDKC